MKSMILFLGLLPFLCPTVFAAEDNPVEKVRLAIAEADLVLELIPKASKEDPLLDKMCLRLGRLSAILRRVKGSTPVPPEETRVHYLHYEHFCGWDPRSTDPTVDDLLPRGFNAESAVTLENLQKLNKQLQIDRDALEAWRAQQG